MLNHPTHDRLVQLRLLGMARALAEQAQLPEMADLTFEERLGLLVDREVTERHQRQTGSRLRRARLKQAAVAEDVDYRHPRGLDRSVFRRLLAGDWDPRTPDGADYRPDRGGQDLPGLRPGQCRVSAGLHGALRAPAAAVGRGARRRPRRRALHRVHGGPRQGRGAGARRLGAGPARRRTSPRLAGGLLDERYRTRSTIITSQLPVAHWHEALGDPTLADAILDRLVHHGPCAASQPANPCANSCPRQRRAPASTPARWGP